MTTVQRGWGYTDDAIAAGSQYDDIVATYGGTIPDAANFWPVTGGTNDKNLEFIDRSDEVRGRRAASPRLPFRARGVMTVPVPTYRSVLEKAFKKTLGGADTVTGAGPAPINHSIAPLGFGGSVALPPVHAQLVRDDYNLKMSGSVFERLSLTFTLDAEGSAEAELHGLYFQNVATPMPAVTFTGLSGDVMMLRDAEVFIDGTAVVNEQQTLTLTGTPTGTFSLSFLGQTAAGLTPTIASAALVTALNGLSTIGAAGVSATGGPLGTAPIVITFSGAALAGINQPMLVPDDSGLVGVHTLTVAETVAGGSNGTGIPDLQGFEFAFMNNTTPKWYARRNIVTRTIGTPAAIKKLWFPAQNKLSAAQDVTYAINFGNTVVAQELAQEFAQIQKFTFDVLGGQLASTPIAYEMLRITIYNAVHGAGQGADALSARDDITSRFEGNGFYSTADSTDIKVEIINTSATPIT